MLNTPDRRRSVRVPVLNHRSLPAALRDVGLGGFSLELPEPLPIDSIHDFDLKIGTGSRVVLRARVAYSLPEHLADGRDVYVTGVEFVDDMTSEALRRTA